jgi:hypothetical protein
MVLIRYFLVYLFATIYIANCQAQSYSTFQIQNENFQLKWLEPINLVKEVGKYDKLELGIKLNKTLENEITQFIHNNKGGINPFNPEEISVEIIFISPSLKKRKIYGFYYKPFIRTGEAWEEKTTEYNWRVRFSPDEIGEWSFVVKIITEGSFIEKDGAKFNCIPSENKGLLKRNYNGDNSDRYLYLSETNEPFFAIGHNIAHSAYYKLTPEKAVQHQKWLTELAENGGNFFRLELGAVNGLPDWNNYKNYTSKMPHMWEFDQLVEHARINNLYFILFRHHTEVMKGEEWDVPKWDNNPYKIGFDLKNRMDYFTNKDVIKWQKIALRYIFSRWGYNTSFAFYEYQEIDNWYEDLQKETGYKDKKAIVLLKNWMVKQKEYIKNELGYDKKLFINTYASTPDWEYNAKSDGMFANSDLIGFHKYGQAKEINYEERYNKAINLWKTWNKPLFIEEMGLDAYGNSDFLPVYICSNTSFHNSIWSTSFMGGAGTGLVWWWDRGIHDMGYYKEYNVIANFFKNEFFLKENYSPQHWHNKRSIKRALIENYALKNEKKTKVIGWVHNATYYWRNISSSCMDELMNKGYFETPFQLNDGYVIGKKKKERTDFNRCSDSYSSKGVQDITDETFKVKGLIKRKIFGKGHWYQIQFYSTINNQEVDNKTYKTNIWGKLKPVFPKSEEQDFSYKINYVGESKKEPK